MVDTPTSNYGLRTQELGSNIATWGDPNLNEVENCIDQILGKIKDIAITGDYTITSTNYVTTADNKNRGWRFTGTLTANVNIIVPSTFTSFIVVNDTTGGFSLTVKTSAGTGVTVPNGRTAWLRCNSVNVLNAFPTHMGTTFTPTLDGDPANVLYVDTAIATAGLPATAGTWLVSGGDTTAGYGEQKLAASSAGAVSITWAKDNPGANETLRPVPVLDTTQVEEFLAVTGKVTATLSAGTTAMTARRRYRISSTATGTLPTMVAGDFVIVEFTVGAGVTGTVGRNSQTIDGTAEDDTYTGDGAEGPVIRYDYASAGAVTSRLIEGIP